MLSRDTDTQLETRRRNAMAIWTKEPDSDRGKRAGQMLDDIDLERARRSLPGAIASFLDEFPKGFHDAGYLYEERTDKLAASEAAINALSMDAFASAFSGDHMPLAREVKRVVNMTNLIQGGFEKPKFVDALLDPANTQDFLRAIQSLIHGLGEPPERLESFSEYLQGLGLRKWTYGTYFLFLTDPANCIYVKPDSMNKAARTAVFDIGYDPAPSATGYRRILEFAHWIESKLRLESNSDLWPEDLIDVQSFIWFMAPTGKFAKA